MHMNDAPELTQPTRPTQAGRPGGVWHWTTRELLVAATIGALGAALTAATKAAATALYAISPVLAAPMTGNTLAKLANGIADTPVTLAAKSHLRNNRPIVLAVSTNDALAGAAENIGKLMARKHYYFVPFRQDDAFGKPTSIVADFGRIPQTLDAAVNGQQIQPLLL